MIILKRLQVFISSTYEDLKEERQAAVEAILKMNHIPAGMELFTGESKEQLVIINKWIDDSDIFLLILGGRYGTIHSSTGKSYVHMELEMAMSLKKPIMIFVMKESLINTKKIEAIQANKIYLYEKDIEIYNDFKVSILNSRLVVLFDSIESLKSEILASLNMLQNSSEYDFVGWVKDNHTASDSTSNIQINTSNVILKNRLECYDYNDIIHKAKEELFISGVNLMSFITYSSTIKGLNHIKTRLLVMNDSNSELINAFRSMKGDNANSFSTDPLKGFYLPSKLDNIEIREIDSIMPTLFMAFDMGTENGYIKAEHFFNASNSTQRPHIELTRENEKWYNIYYEHLEKVWNRAKPWKLRGI